MHQRERRARTRARLLEAALDVFALSGYGDATVDDVAHAAGLSKGALYFHFTSKQDLLLELMRAWTARRTADLRAALETREADAAGALRDVLRALFTYDDFRWPRLLVEFWAEAARSEEVAAALSRAHRRWSRMLAVGIARAVHAPQPGSAEDAAVAVLAMHDGLVCEMALERRMRGPEMRERVVMPLIAFLLATARVAPAQSAPQEADAAPAHLRA